MTETLSTGIEVLDRELDGGLPEGSVLALSASPVSQSELFLYEMAAVRPTVYLTTERVESDVLEGLRGTGTSPENVDVHRISPENPLAEARAAIETLSQRGTLIVDPIRLFEETEATAYRTFMNDLKTRTTETDSLTLLHCLEGRRVPDQRDRTEYLADVIFDLSTELRGGKMENSLSIPKFRGGQALPEAVDLDLTADVTIDVSRKIA
jgi:KaiC/GvpD/RAD55 family RecA-like ATPase